MVVKEDQERVKTLISDTVTLLCRNGLSYKSKFCINALIGITLDESDVFLVDIKETVKSEALADDATDIVGDSDAASDTEQSIAKRTSRKRRKERKRSVNQSIHESASDTESYVDDTHDDDITLESPAKRSVKKEGAKDEEDDEDLVFIKDEPAESDLSSCSFGNIAPQPPQQSDVLGNLAQQGQLYATPTTNALPGPATWDSSQASGFSSPMSANQINASMTSNMGDNTAQLGSLPPFADDPNLTGFFNASIPDPFSTQPPAATKWAARAAGGADVKVCPSPPLPAVAPHSLQCPICQRSYAAKNSLRRHMDCHRGKYPYNCQQCSRGFVNKAAYHAHLATKHNMDDMLVPCPVCGVKFTRKDNMKAHIMLVHSPAAK